MIRTGGLQREHKHYPWIKEIHLKVLAKIQDTEKLEQAEDFYRV